MQEIEVDAVGAQPLEASLASGDGAGARGVLGQHFGDEENLLAAPLDGLGHDLLGAAIGVHLGGIDERHAEIEAKAKRCDLLVALARALAHGPGALPKLWHGFAGREADFGDAAHHGR
jgi:hypothetical protein